MNMGGGPACVSHRPPRPTSGSLSPFSSFSLSHPSLRHPTAIAAAAATTTTTTTSYSSFSPLAVKKIRIGQQQHRYSPSSRIQQWLHPRVTAGVPLRRSSVVPAVHVSGSEYVDSPAMLADQEKKISDRKATGTSLLNVKDGPLFVDDMGNNTNVSMWLCALSCGITWWSSFVEEAQSSQGGKIDMVYEIGELFELGIQLSYLLVLLGLLGAGSFYVIRQVLVRRELDLSAKELQEQVRSGDATATEYFELGAVMLRRKFYPAAKKYLQQAIEKWDRDEQDLAQVYNALGVSYVRDDKLDKGISQFEKAVKLQPGYVTAWNNLGDAYEKKKDLRAALKAFEEVLLFDPNNKLARPRRDALRERVRLYKGIPLKSEDR